MYCIMALIKSFSDIVTLTILQGRCFLHLPTLVHGATKISIISGCVSTMLVIKQSRETRNTEREANTVLLLLLLLFLVSDTCHS